MPKTLIFPLDIKCAECASTTAEFHVELPDSLDGERVPVSVEVRCPGCGRNVIFGRQHARVEVPA